MWERLSLEARSAGLTLSWAAVKYKSIIMQNPDNVIMTSIALNYGVDESSKYCRSHWGPLGYIGGAVVGGSTIMGLTGVRKGSD